MKEVIQKLLFSFFIATAFIMLPMPATVEAQSCSSTGGKSVEGGLSDLQQCAGGTNINPGGIQVTNRGGVLALIAKIIEWALYLAGAIAVLFVIYGGYQYMTAGGSEEQAGSGRKTVVNALIGLVIIILAYVIVNAVAGFISRP